MDQGLAPVQELLLVDARAVADEETLLGGHHAVFQDVGGQLVDVELRVLADGDIAEAHRRALFREHHIQHDGVEAVVVPARVPVVGVVLAGEQQGLAHELGIVQQRLAAGGGRLVVPVHHHALVAGVDGVIVDILLHVHGPAAQMALMLRVLLLQQVLVHQVHDEQVAGLLDVGHARLPKQLEQVDLPDVHVAQAVLLGAVPEHTVGCRAVFQLLPPVVRVGLLVVVVLQDDRQHGGQHLGALLVAALAGEDHRLRVVVHSVRVLIQNAVEQPGRGRLRPSVLRVVRALLALADGLPMAQLPP